MLDLSSAPLSTAGKMSFFPRNSIKISLQYCSISLHFFMYYFIYRGKISLQMSTFPGNQVPKFLFFPGMPLSITWVWDIHILQHKIRACIIFCCLSTMLQNIRHQILLSTWLLNLEALIFSKFSVSRYRPYIIRNGHFCCNVRVHVHTWVWLSPWL